MSDIKMIVLHAISVYDLESVTDKEGRYDLSRYCAVATTNELYRLEDLYLLTNHSGHNWTKNYKVTSLHPFPKVTSLHPFPRSTSIGDIIADVSDPHCIDWFVVTSDGFKKIYVTNACEGLDELLSSISEVRYFIVSCFFGLGHNDFALECNSYPSRKDIVQKCADVLYNTMSVCVCTDDISITNIIELNKQDFLDYNSKD